MQSAQLPAAAPYVNAPFVPSASDGPAVSARDKFGAKKGFGSDAMFDRDDDDDDADARGRDGFDSDRHMVYGGSDFQFN